MKLTNNFTTDELKCPCCGNCEMGHTFMDNLQELREWCSFPFKINSGWRCVEHNKKVSSNSRGQHTTGQACDVAVDNRYRRAKLLHGALKMGTFKDIAVAKTFIHLGYGNQNQGIGIY